MAAQPKRVCGRHGRPHGSVQRGKITSKVCATSPAAGYPNYPMPCTLCLALLLLLICGSCHRPLLPSCSLEVFYEHTNTHQHTHIHTHTLAACFLGQRLVAARLCFKQRQRGRQQQQHEIGGHLNAEGIPEVHCAKTSRGVKKLPSFL